MTGAAVVLESTWPTMKCLLSASMHEASHIFPGGAFEGDDDSAAIVGEISVSVFSLKFEAEGLTLDLPTQGLQLDMDETGERVIFSHANFSGWKIYSLDPSILEHRAFQQPFLKQRAAELRTSPESVNHARRVYMALGIIVLVMVGLWAFTDPIIGVIVKMMPPEWEQKVGKEAYAEMTEIFELTDEPSLTNRVNLVAQRLKKGLPYGAPKFRFHVASSAMINAIALPGGDVIVMQGLLTDSTPDELAGVLAHEMAHVIEKHAMRHIAAQSGPAFITKYLFGGDTTLAGLIAGAGALGQLHYSRDNERQADALAFTILVDANIDPRNLTKFFQKIHKLEKKKGDDEDVFSTHPPTVERIKYLEHRWESLPKKSGFTPVDGGPELPESVREKQFKIFKLPF